jgi:hypothetical protein
LYHAVVRAASYLAPLAPALLLLLYHRLLLPVHQVPLLKLASQHHRHECVWLCEPNSQPIGGFAFFGFSYYLFFFSGRAICNKPSFFHSSRQFFFSHKPCPCAVLWVSWCGTGYNYNYGLCKLAEQIRTLSMFLAENPKHCFFFGAFC